MSLSAQHIETMIGYGQVRGFDGKLHFVYRPANLAPQVEPPAPEPAAKVDCYQQTLDLFTSSDTQVRAAKLVYNVAPQPERAPMAVDTYELSKTLSLRVYPVDPMMKCAWTKHPSIFRLSGNPGFVQPEDPDDFPMFTEEEGFHRYNCLPFDEPTDEEEDEPAVKIQQSSLDSAVVQVTSDTYVQKPHKLTGKKYVLRGKRYQK